MYDGLDFGSQRHLVQHDSVGFQHLSLFTENLESCLKKDFVLPAENGIFTHFCFCTPARQDINVWLAIIGHHGPDPDDSGPETLPIIAMRISFDSGFHLHCQQRQFVGSSIRIHQVSRLLAFVLLSTLHLQSVD